MDINPLLLDLEVIQQVGEYDKLAVDLLPGNTKLFVDSSSYISSFSRWYYGFNREDVILYLEKLIDNIEKTSNLIINGQHNDLSEILKLAIHKSFTGLNHLKNTYIKDSVIFAKIQLLTNKLKMIEKNLESFNVNTLNFVNHQDNNLCISNLGSTSSNTNLNLNTILSMNTNTNKTATATAASPDIKSNTKTNNQKM